MSDARMLKRLMFSTCFSYVAGGRQWALNGGCCMPQDKQGLTDAQLASLRVMGLSSGGAARRGNTDNGPSSSRSSLSRKHIHSTRWTPLCAFPFASPVLMSNIVAWETTRRWDRFQAILRSQRGWPLRSEHVFLSSYQNGSIMALISDAGRKPWNLSFRLEMARNLVACWVLRTKMTVQSVSLV